MNDFYDIKPYMKGGWGCIAPMASAVIVNACILS